MNYVMCTEDAPMGAEVTVHDWRLFSRERMFETETHHQKKARGFGFATMTPTGWREFWYCTRCRLTETRGVAE